MNEKLLVSVIILNFNQKDYTFDCVKSVLNQSFQNFEIIIVDNSSNDGSYSYFVDAFKDNLKIKIFRTKKNLGYAGGNNFGVTKSQGKYIAILNNDTVVKKDWLIWLLKGIENEERVKVVGSIMPLANNSQTHDFSQKGVTLSLTGSTVYYPKKDKKENNFERVFSAGGCSFIYDRSLVDFPFPGEYFAYGEDTYFNWLINLKGYKVVKAIHSKGTHFHNIVRKNSNKKFNNHLLYLSERNLLINFYIFFNLKNIFKISPLMFLRGIAYNLYYLDRIPSNFKAYLWILTHPAYIYRKRKIVQSQRKISDKEIIKMMSYKVYETERVKYSKSMEIFNNFNKLYCRIFNLKTIEMI
jgi:GT2 family glycosyltransferase